MHISRRKTGHVASGSNACSTGTGLETVERLDVVNGEADETEATWVLRGLTSNVRYATRVEVEALFCRKNVKL